MVVMKNCEPLVLGKMESKDSDAALLQAKTDLGPALAIETCKMGSKKPEGDERAVDTYHSEQLHKLILGKQNEEESTASQGRQMPGGATGREWLVVEEGGAELVFKLVAEDGLAAGAVACTGKSTKKAKRAHKEQIRDGNLKTRVRVVRGDGGGSEWEVAPQ